MAGKKKHKKYQAHYYWSIDENRRYCEFLMRFPEIYNLPTNEKKNMKVNVLMSKRIKTRNPQQCHTHHQKMVKKYGSIANIITTMTEELEMSAKIMAKIEEE